MTFSLNELFCAVNAQMITQRMKVFAHRGGPTRAPENTLLAFRRALDDGADGFECDIALTKDGEPVVIHKPFYTNSIAGQINQRGRLDQFRWKDLKEFKTQGQRIPHLSDLLEFVSSNRVECFIEPKIVSAHLIEKIVVAAQHEDVIQKIRLVTFFHRRELLELAKRLDDRIATCVILVWPFGSWLESMRVAKADIVVPGWKRVTPWIRFNHMKALEAMGLLNLKRKVREAHAASTPVYSGIADDEDTIKWLSELGVDGIFTDNVPLVKEVLSGLASRSYPSYDRSLIT
jgi:glycerophosphoryl diester phosphodiesterase